MTAGVVARGDSMSPRTEGALLLAALSWVAAMIHSVVAVPHFTESAPAGVLFAVAAGLQAAWGAQVYRRPTRALLAGGIALNAGLVLVWGASRTPEPVGLADLGASVAELVLVAGSVSSLHRPWGTADVPPWTRRLVLAVLLFAGLTLVLAAPHHG